MTPDPTLVALYAFVLPAIVGTYLAALAIILED
jgi:hypothetical protein